MKTIQDFFNSSSSHPFHTDRLNKIEELKKPVYNKKIRQRKTRLSLPKYQLVKTIYSGNNNYEGQRNTTPKAQQQRKVIKSKSELFVNKNHQNQQSTSSSKSKNHLLASHLIIEKLDYSNKRDLQASPHTKKNNFIKLVERITMRISSSPVVTKNISLVKTNSQNTTPKTEKTIQQFKQGISIIDIIKKEDIQSSLVNQIGQLRKKRNSCCQSSNQDKGQGNNKMVSSRNSLFFTNYLKQKEKKHQHQHQIEKSPHINLVKNSAQVIKVQEHIDLRKVLLNRDGGQKDNIIFRTKLSLEKLQKANKIFNSMKIQPW